MIGIVVVSHSPALARAAVELALEMVPHGRPPIALAAGTGDGMIGTDAVAVANAIDEVAVPDGVLVIVDLGSAVMSAEMAFDLVTTTVPVRLSSAPFVEGLLAAIVTAAGGASLVEVDREARGALQPKIGMLGGTDDSEPMAAVAEPAAAPGSDGSGPLRTSSAGYGPVLVTVLMPLGLHARPAATLVSTAAGYDAKLTVANQRTGAPAVAANSLIGLLSLGAGVGDVLEITASGAQSGEALEAVVALFADGFGELQD